MFAPGHAGELTWVVPSGLVDAVLEEAGARERRLRLLPSRVGACFVLAMCLFPRPGRTATRRRRSCCTRWPATAAN